jgi:hypothetical protein
MRIDFASIGSVGSSVEWFLHQTPVHFVFPGTEKKCCPRGMLIHLKVRCLIKTIPQQVYFDAFLVLGTALRHFCPRARSTLAKCIHGVKTGHDNSENSANTYHEKSIFTG